jgi:hypothetical protein
MLPRRAAATGTAVEVVALRRSFPRASAAALCDAAIPFSLLVSADLEASVALRHHQAVAALRYLRDLAFARVLLGLVWIGTTSDPFQTPSRRRFLRWYGNQAVRILEYCIHSHIGRNHRYLYHFYPFLTILKSSRINSGDNKVMFAMCYCADN